MRLLLVFLSVLLLGACGDDAAVTPDAPDGPGGGADAPPATCPSPPSRSGDLALTDEGPIRGVAEAGTIAWKGIAYAQPPLAERRFRAPEPLGCVAAERQASAFGPRCPQLDDAGAVEGEEDCLSLNVWAPAAEAAPRPVLVFLHGGGNVQGSASAVTQGAELYHGAELAAGFDVLVVTVQYRLGALGFLAHPALTAEDAGANSGLADQLLALDWVQRNAAAFGGDPTRVLLFGESAGALDTCALLAAPAAAGRFTRALMQSGGCRARSLAAAESDGQELATAAGCAADGAAACLRAAGADTLVLAQGGSPVSGGLVQSRFGPVVDGAILTESPIDAIRAGRHHHVPFVVGANADETASLGVPAMTEAGYEARVRQIFGETVGDMVLATYPASDYASPRQAFIQVTTDAQFVCPSRAIARAAASNQSEPVYRYFYTHRLAGTPGATVGAGHGLELFFVFQKIDETKTYTANADDLAVAATMGGAWTAFAAAGDPNDDGLPTWPMYDVATDPYLEIAPTSVAGQGVRTEKCDFWDGITLGP